MDCTKFHSSIATPDLNVIYLFYARGYKPLRTMALANCSGVISGSLERSISLSHMASTRFRPDPVIPETTQWLSGIQLNKHPD